MSPVKSKINEKISDDMDIVDESKRYNELKSQLSDIQRYKKSKAVYLFIAATSMVLSFLAGSILFNAQGTLTISTVAIAAFIGILCACFLSSYFYLLCDLRESSIRRRMIDYETANVQEEVSDDIFENSVKMSYKYLDQYYLQTREHAQRGFFVTVCVSLFGAILILGGIIGMFLGHVTPSLITCASGVVTEFISSVFFYLYNKTVSSMSKYHNKLVLSQNISIALKVADSLSSEDKIKAKNGIISELLKDINTHLVKEDSCGKESVHL